MEIKSIDFLDSISESSFEEAKGFKDKRRQVKA